LQVNWFLDRAAHARYVVVLIAQSQLAKPVRIYYTVVIEGYIDVSLHMGEPGVAGSGKSLVLLVPRQANWVLSGDCACALGASIVNHNYFVTLARVVLGEE